MPRPRFDKLDPDKRERILTAAAQEFAANGYQNASMNKILDEAGISKGAAYYYFDDKADLFSTVVITYWDDMLGTITFDPADLTADTFWPTIASTYRQQFTRYREQPWMVGIIKAVGDLSPEELASGPLAGRLHEIVIWLGAILQRGQTLGVVRTDLPDDLLTNLIMGIDRAADDYLLDHWDDLTPEEAETILDHILEAMQRIARPA